MAALVVVAAAADAAADDAAAAELAVDGLHASYYRYSFPRSSEEAAGLGRAAGEGVAVAAVPALACRNFRRIDHHPYSHDYHIEVGAVDAKAGDSVAVDLGLAQAAAVVPCVETGLSAAAAAAAAAAAVVAAVVAVAALEELEVPSYSRT